MGAALRVWRVIQGWTRPANATWNISSLGRGCTGSQPEDISSMGHVPATSVIPRLMWCWRGVVSRMALEGQVFSVVPDTNAILHSPC
jgi:hypothetical protein